MQLDPPSCLRRMVELVVMKPAPAIDPRYQHKKQFRLLLDRKLAKAKSGGDSMSALACCHSSFHACLQDLLVSLLGDMPITEDLPPPAAAVAWLMVQPRIAQCRRKYWLHLLVRIHLLICLT